LLHSVSGRADNGGTGGAKPGVCYAGLSSPAGCEGVDVARWLVKPLDPSTDSADRQMAQEAVIAAEIHDWYDGRRQALAWDEGGITHWAA